MEGTHPFLVNFPQDDWDRLDAAARDSGRSRTQLILDACRAAAWAELPPRVSPLEDRWRRMHETRKDADL